MIIENGKSTIHEALAISNSSPSFEEFDLRYASIRSIITARARAKIKIQVYLRTAVTS